MFLKRSEKVFIKMFLEIIITTRMKCYENVCASGNIVITYDIKEKVPLMQPGPTYPGMHPRQYPVCI